MGLAGPRKRVKISHDPNNTAWTRSESGYGQKILSAQGWSPGSFLGAIDAAHADHYSSASASHVRVLVKDGTLGVGASRGQADTVKTGLGSFQDLLGRLNGKTEVQVEHEKKARKELGRRTYVAQRWGSTNFVKAGYLVGDRMEDLEVDLPGRCSAASQAQPSLALDATRTRLSDPFAWAEPSPSPKRKKRRKLRSNDSVAHDEPPSDTAVINDSHSVKSSSTDKERRHDSPVRTETPAIAEHQKRSKEQRKIRKAENKRRREERQARREVKVTHASSIPSQCQPSSDNITANAILSPISKTITTVRPQGARQRNIQHKRMAMDPRALQEILMVKPVK